MPSPSLLESCLQTYSFDACGPHFTPSACTFSIAGGDQSNCLTLPVPSTLPDTPCSHPGSNVTPSATPPSPGPHSVPTSPLPTREVSPTPTRLPSAPRAPSHGSWVQPNWLLLLRALAKNPVFYLMSQTGIQKLRGNLVLVFTDKHRHTTHNCTNPVHYREETGQKNQGVRGVQNASTNAPQTRPQPWEGRSGERTIQHTGRRACHRNTQYIGTQARRQEALKRALGRPCQGGWVPRPLLQTWAEVPLPRAPQAVKGRRPPCRRPGWVGGTRAHFRKLQEQGFR